MWYQFKSAAYFFFAVYIYFFPLVMHRSAYYSCNWFSILKLFIDYSFRNWNQYPNWTAFIIHQNHYLILKLWWIVTIVYFHNKRRILFRFSWWLNIYYNIFELAIISLPSSLLIILLSSVMILYKCGEFNFFS